MEFAKYVQIAHILIPLVFVYLLIHCVKHLIVTTVFVQVAIKDTSYKEIIVNTKLLQAISTLIFIVLVLISKELALVASIDII